MPGPYPFDQILAMDPSNPLIVARDSDVLLYAPGDASKSPLVIWDVSRSIQLANPVRVNSLGFGPAFLHDTLDQVAWSSGSLGGLFSSYRGLKSAAEAAQYAAELAASAAQSVTTNGVPTGGTTGQVLAKTSNVPYAVGWIEPPEGGGGGASNFNELIGILARNQLPAAVTLTVRKGTTWPARPTDRADIVVRWIGADPSPNIVDSGTGGMLRNVDERGKFE